MLAAAATGLVGSAAGQPSLRIEPPAIELGTVLQHEVRQEELLILNQGTEPLVIKDVGKTCPDCLVPFLPQRVLAPGEAVSLLVDVLPGDASGALDAMLVLETDHADIGNVGIPVQAYIEPSYAMAGAPFLVEVQEEGERPSQLVYVTPNFSMQGRLNRLSSASEVFDVGIQADPVYPDRYLVTVNVVSDLPVGMTHEVLELESTHPDDPPCRIHASVFLPPPYHVYPVRLRVAPTDREQLRILFMDQRMIEPVELLDVRVPNPHVTWEYFKGFELERSRLNVYIHNQRGVEGYIGDIVLVTDYRACPEFRVPVFVDPRVPSALGPNRWPSVAANRQGCGCNVRR